MDDEMAFLRSIAAAPADDLPKLVFADYLDERGDAAGEGLRVAVKRRWRPVYFPRFAPHADPPYRWSWLRLRSPGSIIRRADGSPRRRADRPLPWWLFGLMKDRCGNRPTKRHQYHLNHLTAEDAWAAFLRGWRRAVAAGRWPRPLAPVETEIVSRQLGR